MRTDAHNPDNPPRPRVLRAAVAVWAVLMLGISVRVLVAPVHSHNVFGVYHKAAENWVGGHDLYAYQPGLDVFHYSPLAAAGMVPFGALPVKVGGVLWRLANAAALLGGLAWCCRALWPHFSASRRGWLFLLVVPLSVASLNNGQSNALVLGLILLGLAACARERWWLAAFLVSGAVALKVYPVAVGMLLAACYPRRFAPRFAVGLVAAAVVPFALQSPDYVLGQYRSWFAAVSADDRSGLPLHLWLRDIRLLFHVWLVPLSPLGFASIQLAVAALIAGVCVLGRRCGWGAPRVLTTVLGLGCCWMTVFGPMVESCTWILVAPALAAGFIDGGRWRRVALGGSGALFMIDMSFGWWRGGREYRGWGLQPTAGLLMFGTLLVGAVAELRRKRAEPEAVVRKAA